MKEWETYLQEKVDEGLLKSFLISHAKTSSELKAIMGERPPLTTRTHKKFSEVECWGLDLHYYENCIVGVDLECFIPGRKFLSKREELLSKYQLPLEWGEKELLEEWTRREAVFKCLSLSMYPIKTIEQVIRNPNTTYRYFLADERQQIRTETLWVADSVLTLAYSRPQNAVQ